MVSSDCGDTKIPENEMHQNKTEEGTIQNATSVQQLASIIITETFQCYMYTHTDICIHIYMYIFTDIHTYICIYTVYAQIQMHTYIHIGNCTRLVTFDESTEFLTACKDINCFPERNVMQIQPKHEHKA